MTELIFTALSIFPISFLAFSWTERTLARHESRVGRQITLPAFLLQTWVDTWREAGMRRSIGFWLLFGFQCSLPFLYSIDLEYLIFPWLGCHAFIIARTCPVEDQVLRRIDSDQGQVRFAVAAGLALLSLLGAFTLARTASLASPGWGLSFLLLSIPFQFAGMILLGERPFLPFLARNTWFEAAPFYGWCLVTTRVFLGGGEYFIDSNLKAGALFWLSRVIASYFPNYRQRDLMRISVLNLLPIAGLILILMMLSFAWSQGGIGL